jgi:hypothetical protein
MVVVASSAILTVEVPADTKLSVNPVTTSETVLLEREIEPIPVIENSALVAGLSLTGLRLVRAPPMVVVINPRFVPSLFDETTIL